MLTPPRSTPHSLRNTALTIMVFSDKVRAPLLAPGLSQDENTSRFSDQTESGLISEGNQAQSSSVQAGVLSNMLDGPFSTLKGM
ncbi:hypothetical protein TNCV_1421941 [Trichonephila clavipes]|nr:hypothetical protein TNCV_1421941 [Trichonephila clavipes]